MLKVPLASADDRLIRRLEYGHADSGLAYARAYLEQHPESEVAFERIGSGWAIYQGPDSPQTQALAFGMNGPETPQELARLEEFFHSRGTAAVLDLASMADPSVLALLQDRALTIREISNVMARKLCSDEDLATDPSILVEEVAREEIGDWARLVISGFTGQDEVSDDQVTLFAAAPAYLRSYFARLGGDRAAGAAMSVVDRLATFVGDATLSAKRRSGLQLALIAYRLREASRMGCDLASATVIPGGSSHRNYERAGFELIYSRIQIAIPK